MSSVVWTSLTPPHRLLTFLTLSPQTFCVTGADDAAVARFRKVFPTLGLIRFLSDDDSRVGGRWWIDAPAGVLSRIDPAGFAIQLLHQAGEDEQYPDVLADAASALAHHLQGHCVEVMAHATDGMLALGFARIQGRSVAFSDHQPGLVFVARGVKQGVTADVQLPR